MAIGVGSMHLSALLAGARSAGVDLLMAAGRYTLVTPDITGDVLAACRANSVDVIAAAVFNGGLLAASPSKATRFDYGPVPDSVLRRARRLEAICADFDIPLRVAALQFPLREPSVRSVIVGGDTPAQIKQNADDLQVAVPPELWRALAAEAVSL